MDDGLVSTSKVIAWCLWVWTGTLVLATWIAAATESHYWGPVATTACVSSCVASAAQVKVYVNTVCVHLRLNRAAIERHGGEPRQEIGTLRGL